MEWLYDTAFRYWALLGGIGIVLAISAARAWYHVAFHRGWMRGFKAAENLFTPLPSPPKDNER